MVMARPRTPNRLDDIVEAATQRFVTDGYRLTPIEAIAEQAGVSSATVYLYAESKEALFDLVIRRCFHEDLDDSALPHRAPKNGFADAMVARLEAVSRFPTLDAGVSGRSRISRAGFERMVRELYAVVFRYRRAITLVEKCGRDWPELNLLFRHHLRARLLTSLAAYLEVGSRKGKVLRPVPDSATAARALLEMVAWFAMHRFTAGGTSDYDDGAAEETVVQILVNGFAYER